jgi:sugar O-acyltransferase (sialic acid O-acetyltransferase NeuD family)
MKKNIVLIGCSGHAKVVIDIIEREGKYNIVGIFDKPENIGKSIFEYSVLDIEDNILKYKESLNIHGGIVAIGNNWLRKKVAQKILGLMPDFHFINAIHPSCNIGKNVSMGVGNVLVAGVTVNAEAAIGNHCILNTNASLGHEAVMHDFSVISPNVAVGGNSKIGELSTLGISATVIHHISIGKCCMVGAGSVVIKDIPDESFVFGNPVKIIKQRKCDDKTF